MATHKITLYVSGTDAGAVDLAAQVRGWADSSHTECAVMGLKVKPVAQPLLVEKTDATV